MAERSTTINKEDGEEEYQRLISTLPTSKGFMSDTRYQYYGFWFGAPSLRGTLIAQKQDYHSSSSSSFNVLLASHPKTGTTWLKALLFAITTRTHHQMNNHNHNPTHPLLTSNPHDLVPSIEFHALHNPSNPVPENTCLLATHIPFNLLPDSIKSSSTNCKIVYVYRDPKDVLISLWHYANRFRNSSSSSTTLLSLESAVDLFCEGKSICGPYWDHVLGYWEQNPVDRLLFLSYEELQKMSRRLRESYSSVDCMMKLAEFVGQPFTADEVDNGVPERIIDLCSFNKLRDLKVNKCDSVFKSMPDFMKMMTNDIFFRKGEVGDYRNYLSEEMIMRIDGITEVKWAKVGFVY